SLPATIQIKKTHRWTETGLKSVFKHESELIEILAQAPSQVYIPGAITETSLPKLKRAISSYGGKIIIRHPYNLKLGMQSLEWLLHNSRLCTLIPFHLGAIAINSHAVGNSPQDALGLRTRLKEKYTHCPVFDIYE
ncbi:MAG: hypothetical protein U1C33_06925, partial [Candidatus Cloacimonadaceae bacterium]|nr:hypothetical protein [Candidatus Cloacimonadaceae bacterium]